jgi:hypothetical protein
MTIEERLKRLENELVTAKRLNRRLIAGAGFVLGVLIMFLAVRATPEVAYSQAAGDVTKVIRAQSFEVVDDQGKTYAMLNVFKNAPWLTLYDEKGTYRAMLYVFNGVPSLDLYDEKGKRRTSLFVTKEGAELNLYDNKGQVIWDTTQ